MREIVLYTTMWIVTVCTYVSYLPQLYKLIKTKKAEDLSITSWISWMISSLANLIYSVLLGRFELIIASVSEFILISAVLFLTVYYTKSKRYRIETDEEFKARLNKIRQKDGNHMILMTAMIQEREKLKQNSSSKV